MLRILMLLMIFWALPASIVAQKASMLVGTYTNGKSEGIYLFEFDEKTGEAAQHAIQGGIRNPSFLAMDPQGKFAYAVSELNGGGDAGKVFSYQVDPGGRKLIPLNVQSSGGDDPCYLTVDKSGKWLIVGNYSSGSLSVLPILPDGSLGGAVVTLRHEGSGPNRERQEKPHVHATVLSPDNRFLYVPDLGADKVFIYRFDASTGLLTPAPQAFQVANPGSGPRHFVIAPNGKFAYLVEELTGSVSSYSVDPVEGRLSWIQRLSSLPTGFSGFGGSADIHISPDGRFLYASNRGDANNLAIFRIDARNGNLSAAGHQSVLGKKPRNFSLSASGNWLLCANQDSDEIVVFRRNTRTGELTDSGKRISVPSPVCIRWFR